MTAVRYWILLLSIVLLAAVPLVSVPLTAWAQSPGLTPDETNTIATFKRSARSVVYIVNLQRVREPFTTQSHEIEVGSGSGFIISSDGLIVTNAHVVEGASSLKVHLQDRTELAAMLVGVAPDKDIALLRVSAPADRLPPLEPGDSDALLVGQKVLAIGNPFGLDHTLTVGVVSALNRETQAPTGRRIRGMIQTDAAINPGNSGGPLLDSAGHVVGMNSSILSPGGEGNIGIGFAVPVNMIAAVVPQLLKFGRVIRPTLGVALAEEAFSRTLGLAGVVVLAVVPGSGAAKAGMLGLTVDPDGNIRLGNVIVGLDGDTVHSREDLLDVLEMHVPGDTVTVTALKGVRPIQYKVTLGAGS